MLNTLKTIVDTLCVLIFVYVMFFSFLNFLNWLGKNGLRYGTAVAISFLMWVSAVYGATKFLDFFSSP